MMDAYLEQSRSRELAVSSENRLTEPPALPGTPVARLSDCAVGCGEWWTGLSEDDRKSCAPYRIRYACRVSGLNQITARILVQKPGGRRVRTSRAPSGRSPCRSRSLDPPEEAVA